MRDRWVPISRADQPDRRQRAGAVARDVALHATGSPCPDCGHLAWLSGGPGCQCLRTARGIDLAARRLTAGRR